MIVRLHRVWHTERGQCSAKSTFLPFQPLPSHMHSSISVYTCSVRVPQAHTPGTETVPGYNARGQEKICTRSVTNPLCTPPFVAQLTLQTSYILGFSSASAHKQSHYWPDATREGRRCGACEAGSRRDRALYTLGNSALCCLVHADFARYHFMCKVFAHVPLLFRKQPMGMLALFF